MYIKLSSIKSCQSNINISREISYKNNDKHCAVQSNASAENPFRVLDRGYLPINFNGKVNASSDSSLKNLNAEMEYADAIMNNMKNKYGFISPSKVMYTFQSKPTSAQRSWLNEKQQHLEDLRNNYPSTDDKTKFIDNLIKNVNTNGSRIANCFESAKLAEIALNANGIKNLSTVKLVGYTDPKFRSSYGLDHTFILVNGDLDNKNNEPWDKPKERYGKNAYVVDPWLGFVDTVENAMEIYKKTWEKIPHYNAIIGYGMEEAFNASLDLNKNDANRTRIKYPELIVDKNSDLTKYKK